jgi:O-methyltransferase involved in polyketide biosynthesis
MALSAPGSRLATEHMDIASLPADWADKLTQRTQRIGSDINLAELFYLGERNSAADYLSAQGWHVDVRRTEQAFAANGFTLPDDEMAAFGGDSGYLTATLT